MESVIYAERNAGGIISTRGTAAVTQEFHLSITPVGDDRYLIRTESVEPGVPLAEAQVNWPVADWLEEARRHPHNPLMQLLQSDAEAATGGVTEPAGKLVTAPLTPAAHLVQFGQTLYNALFTGRIRDSWLAAQGIAQNQHQILHLRLGFKDSRLQRLPWEILYGDDRPLATGNDVTLARYYVAQGMTERGALPALPPADQPLQVLMVISAPDDQERLALRREVQHLQQELETARISSGEVNPLSPQRSLLRPIHLTLLEQPNRAQLVQALEQGGFHVLHYAGHSDVGESGGDLFLVNPETGLTDRLTGEDLAGLLVNNGIAMAVFNSCRGAYTATDDADAGWREQNLVQSLVNRGVPGVVAMAERIPDEVALMFTRLLYRSLRRGYPIDLSMSRTRQGLISTYGSDQVYWMLPILYLHPEFDGYLHQPLGDRANTEELDPWLLDDMALAESTATALALAQEEGSDPSLVMSPHADADLEALLDDLAGDGADYVNREDSDYPDYGDDDYGDGDYDDDAEVVSDLLTQLSSPTVSDRSSPLPAHTDEELSPAWQRDRPPLEDRLPENPSYQVRDKTYPGIPPVTTPADATDKQPAIATEDASPKSRFPFSTLPPALLWIGLGLTGAAAATVLAVAALQQQFFSQSPNNEPPQPIPAPTDPVASSSQAYQNALVALKAEDMARVRQELEILLQPSQNNLASVQAVLMQATPTQRQENPDLAYVEGRFDWQSIPQGNASAFDALRAWKAATDNRKGFLEALVALGFAYYETGEYQKAIVTWNQAVNVDQGMLQDGTQNGPYQAARPEITGNAFAGLAMVYVKYAEQTDDPGNTDRFLQNAQDYWAIAKRLQPNLINDYPLDWLWGPVTTDLSNTIQQLESSGLD